MRQTINARTIATQRGTVIPSGAPPAETGEVLTRKHASTASIFAGLLKANTIRRIECEQSGHVAQKAPGPLEAAPDCS
jgi:hypothetical protein